MKLFIARSITVALAAVVSPVSAQEKLGMLLAAGDIASCVERHDPSKPPVTDKEKKKAREREIKSGLATANLVINEIKESKKLDPKFPVAVLGLGDLAYDCGTAAAFQCFEESWGQIRKELLLDGDDRFLLVPGNHEYAPKRAMGTKAGSKVVCIRGVDKPKKTERHADPFFQYYKSSLEKMGASSGSYSVKFPASSAKAWHLIGLNPYAGTPLVWLKKDLSNSQSSPCVLTFTHAYYYSSGHHGHGDKEDKKGKKAAKVPSEFMAPYFKLLYDNRVSVLLAGHDHHFEQLGRADASSKADPARGLRSFIVGTGGKRLYSAEYADQWPFQEGIDRGNYGILKINLFTDRYDWEFVPVPPAETSMKISQNVKSDGCVRPQP